MLANLINIAPYLGGLGLAALVALIFLPETH